MAAGALMSTAKVHWRALWPVWFLPIFFYAGAHISESLGRFDLFLFAIASPAFVVAFLWAFRPWIKGSITTPHALFWLILVPGLISLTCVLVGDLVVGIGRT
jgi:hypothetical protein